MREAAASDEGCYRNTDRFVEIELSQTATGAGSVESGKMSCEEAENIKYRSADIVYH